MTWHSGSDRAIQDRRTSMLDDAHAANMVLIDLAQRSSAAGGTRLSFGA